MVTILPIAVDDVCVECNVRMASDAMHATKPCYTNSQIMLCAMRNWQPKTDDIDTSTTSSFDMKPAPSLDFFVMPENTVPPGRKRQVMSHATRRSLRKQKSWKSKLDPFCHVPLSDVVTVDIEKDGILSQMLVTTSKGNCVEMSFFSSNGSEMMLAFLEVWVVSSKLRRNNDKVGFSGIAGALSDKTDRGSRVPKRSNSRASVISVDMDNFAGHQMRNAIKNESPAESVKWEVNRICLDIYDSVSFLCEDSCGNKGNPLELENGKDPVMMFHPASLYQLDQSNSLIMEPEVHVVGPDHPRSLYQ